MWSGLDEERRRAFVNFKRLRERRNIPVVVAGFLACAFFEAALFTSMGGWTFLRGGLALFSLGALAFAVGRGTRLGIGWAELDALGPVLRLSPIGRAYLDARLLLERLELSPETCAELTTGLDGLLDEETRLTGTRGRLGVRAAQPEAIAAEGEALRSRLAATDDPLAREALAYGLATSERRLAGARRSALAGERIDAQLAMIEQAAGDVRDALYRMGTVPGGSEGPLDLTPIRQTLLHVQDHAAAVEGAVDELDALRGSG